MEAIVITKENFEEQVLRAEKPVLVDFWAPWCTYCRRIAPAVDQVAGQYGEQMVVGKVNVDEQPELAERFGVETIPTLLVFRNGQAGEPLIAPGSIESASSPHSGSLYSRLNDRRKAQPHLPILGWLRGYSSYVCIH